MHNSLNVLFFTPVRFVHSLRTIKNLFLDFLFTLYQHFNRNLIKYGIYLKHNLNNTTYVMPKTPIVKMKNRLYLQFTFLT